MADALTTWFTESPFSRDLGVVRRADGRVAISSNRAQVAGDVLHGGAVAALAALAAQGTDPEVRSTNTSLQIDYVRAARGDGFSATASTVRRVRELGFHRTTVHDADGQVVAVAGGTLSAERAGRGNASPATPLAPDPGDFSRALGTMPFLLDRGLRVGGVGRGEFEVTMPPAERNLDANGRIHVGAVLTLIDVAGTSVPWTLARPSGTGATVSLQARFLGEVPAGGLTARARVRAHDDRVHWSDIEVFAAEERELCALGSVVYRFA
ncbi:uncharacterized protein (TIGR00369 family) [Saccharothrix saharensis]|uniref:Uncharacterized protein (TIGR00369 family) n=1 Tax=Saccharothrix saharensis TaxID=571190 RepID=A0A543J6G5_9PSEU|nr:hotdog fold thioesterase [Saccharothrix saharensis]TQM78413.1 uncharacterized protein (TIGR00369 family) [Saccharothrix saharensis]